MASPPAAAPPTPVKGGAGDKPAAAGGAKAAADDSRQSRVRVCVRVRPFFARENIAAGPCVEPVPSDGAEALLRLLPSGTAATSASAARPSEERVKVKAFDHLFWSIPPSQCPVPPKVKVAGNAEIYATVGRSALENAFRGLNATIFAYGQTGSGKTYTMLGYAPIVDPPGGAAPPPAPATGAAALAAPPPPAEPDPGIIPRLCVELFEWVEAGGPPSKREMAPGMRAEFEVRMSFLEVFNDVGPGGGTVRDLLPYDRFKPEEAKRVREEYAKFMAKDRAARTPGVPMDAVLKIVRKAVVAREMTEDEVETKGKMLFDYKKLDRTPPQVFNPALDSMEEKLHAKEFGILASKMDELGYDDGERYYPKGLAERRVNSWAEISALLELGTKRRKVAATDFHLHSSRSHAIVMLKVDMYYVSTAACAEGETPLRDRQHTATINLVDLAGSERLDKAGTGALGMASQTISINQSLHFLGRVINALGKKGATRKSAMGEIRMSALTRLLSSSLGGNAETYMVAAVSPAVENFEETLSTLNYATTAREIVNVVRVNTTSSTVGDRLEELKKFLQSGAESSERLRQLQSQLAAAEQFKKSLEEQRVRDLEDLDQERERRAAAEQQVAMKDKELMAARDELKRESSKTEEARKALEAKEQEVRDLRAKHQRDLEERVRWATDNLKDKSEQLSTVEELQRRQREELDAKSTELETISTDVRLKDRQIGVLQEMLDARSRRDTERLEELEGTRREISRIQSEADSAKRAASELQLTITERHARVQELESALETRVASLTALEQEVAARERELAEKDTRIQNVEEELRKRESLLVEREEQLKQTSDLLKKTDLDLKLRLGELERLQMDMQVKEEESKALQQELDRLTEEKTREAATLDQLVEFAKALNIGVAPS